MKLTGKLIFVGLLASTQINAAIMKVQSPACISQSTLSEFAHANNAGAGRLILNQECFIVEPGTSYNLINKQSSVSLIRVYWDSNGYKLWVPNWAIR